MSDVAVVAVAIRDDVDDDVMIDLEMVDSAFLRDVDDEVNDLISNPKPR